MRIADLLLPEFDQEMASTRKTLERCPDEKFSWKPHDKSFPMGTLATHLANMPRWLVDTIESDEFDVAPSGTPPYKETPAASNRELLDTFDQRVAAARKALSGVSDEDLMKPWSLRIRATRFSRCPGIRLFVASF